MLNLHSERNLLQTILETVANYFEVKVEDIIGPCRKQELVEIRWSAIFLAHLQGIGTREIGQAVSRDHTTVCYAIEKMKKSIRNSLPVANAIKELKQKVETQ